jgi:hypothetical protein
MSFPGNRVWLALAFLLFATISFANAVVSIDDRTDTIAFNVSGFDITSLRVQAVAESFDMHGEYFSNLGTTLGNGETQTLNFNVYESPGLLSDTLNIVLTGDTFPTAGECSAGFCGTPGENQGSVVSVDLHFRSDTDNSGGLPPLVNGIVVGEKADVSSFIDAVGVGDLTVNFDATPEPAMWGPMVIVFGGILLTYRRRSHTNK